MKWMHQHHHSRVGLQGIFAIALFFLYNAIHSRNTIIMWPVGCAAFTPTLRNPFVRTFPSRHIRRFTVRRETTSSSLSFPIDDMTGWTVDRILKESTRQLTVANVTEPDWSVQHLLADSLQLSWKTGFREILNEGSTIVTAEQARDFQIKLHRRLQHEPLQYILGQWDFLDYTINIKPPLLCPRPETEELVMRILDEARTVASSSSASSSSSFSSRPIRILDVGCGTGVIGLSLLAASTTPKYERYWNVGFVQAIDIDPVAIETSLENAVRILGGNNDDKQSQQQQGDGSLLSRYEPTLCSAEDYTIDDPEHGTFDIVLSNPPYIPRADMDGLSEDVRGYENDFALCGGEDGMDVIRIIVLQLRYWCHSGSTCWMEVDPTHPRLIEEWLSEESEESKTLGVVFEAGYQDMFGNDRFVKLRVL